ncbi:AraC family transcriptional regulator [Streptomyces sp. SS52]|uniref:AraC family transcriptional regulator n=1 Tax=Streptomyces rochei TaxID=1928 RepID=UPI00049480C3|nr:AraC family transcriptional regulator [Streptomyces sp. SS52]
MKENGQFAAGRRPSGIPRVSYRPTPGRPPGLEVLDLPGLAVRAAGRELPLTLPARPDFHLIVAVRGGRVACSVDFTSYTARAGDWLWVWPGQVLRFPDGPGDCDATVLVFPTGFPSAATDVLIRDGEHAPCRLVSPDAARQAALLRYLDALVDEHRELPGLALEAYIETLRHLLSVILIRLVHLADPRRTRSAGSEPFHLFRRAVEEGFGRTHRVEDYAARLGYSARTLTRATRAALGCGAKRYIDDRVLLEAKRLLIHTSLPPAAVSERVGFAYPTVFSAFFRQRTGMTPTEFRSLAKP